MPPRTSSVSAYRPSDLNLSFLLYGRGFDSFGCSKTIDFPLLPWWGMTMTSYFDRRFAPGWTWSLWIRSNGISNRSKASRTHPGFSVLDHVVYIAMRGRSMLTVSAAGAVA